MDDKKTLVNGTYWTTLSTVFASIIQILTLAILSRFLEKTDFGLVAIVTTIYGLIQTFVNLGFSTAIMHKRGLSSEEFSSLFWIQFLVFASIYILSIVFTPIISSFYAEEKLNSILPLFLVSLLLLGIGQLYGTLLLKEMQFKIVAIRNMTSQTAAIIVALSLAYLNFGVYSLVFSLLAQIAVVNIWNFISGSRQIKVNFGVSLVKVKPLVRIGLFQTGSSVLDYLSSSIDVFLIGKFLGMENLGVYNLAKELVQKIVSLFTTISRRVATPFFSKIQDKKSDMSLYYCKMIHILSILNFPLCVILGCFSSLIVYLLYGASNLIISPILTILAIWGMLVSVGGPVSNIVVATGRTDLAFIYTIIRIIIVLPLNIVFALWGNLVLMALCTFIGEFIICLISCKIELTMTIGLAVSKFLAAFLKQFIFSALYIILIYEGLRLYYHNYYLNIYVSITIFSLFISVYLILYYLINRKTILELKTVLLSHINVSGILK